MSGFMGADTEALRRFSRQVGHSASQLERLQGSLASAVGSARWAGPDAEAFHDRWKGHLDPALSQIVSRLRHHQRGLASQADDQDAASGADTSGRSPGDGWADSGAGTGHGYRGDASGDDGDVPLDPKDREGDPEIPQAMEDSDKDSASPDHGYEEPLFPIDLDPDQFTVDSIHQHAVNDCWFLASLGATVRSNPEFVRQNIEDNGDGTYTVTLYDKGEPVEITVNGTFNNGGVEDGTGDPNWASIYEKAAAEYMGGSYKDLDFDHTELGLEMVTGKDARYDEHASLEDVRSHLADGPVVVDTKPQEDGWWLFKNDHVERKDIVPNHSYIVDGVENRENPPGSGHTEPMVHVLNPWGPNAQYNNKPTGDLWLTQHDFDENFSRTNYVENPDERS